MTFTLSDGDLIVYPTSTLPGLGCLPTQKGLDNLYSTKNRPASMPVSLGVARLEQAEEMVVLPDFISEFLDSFPRGGITTILPARQKVDPRLGGENIAIRVFSHPSAIELAEEFGPLPRQALMNLEYHQNVTQKLLQKPWGLIISSQEFALMD